MAGLEAMGNPRQARVVAGFFKTGPGEYGEGDIFLGLRVPDIRGILPRCDGLREAAVLRLLRDPIHEARFLALLILVRRFQRGDGAMRKRVFDFYVKHRRWINNWDLVDCSAEQVLGGWLFSLGKTRLLDRLARSKNLWDRRLAMIATLHFIRAGEFGPTLRISEVLLADPEDLLHKATGWMLREVGKRDQGVEDAFLRRHYRRMPRTMLRYAIERFPETRRRAYLAGTV